MSSRKNVKNGKQKKNRVRKWRHVKSALMQKVKNQEKLIFQASRAANPRASSSTTPLTLQPADQRTVQPLGAPRGVEVVLGGHADKNLLQ